MTCLYCKSDAPAKGVEHVYPDGLGHHSWTLPRGAVCDRCNSGVLSKLDQAIVAYPRIAATLFWFQVPGKDGKIRKRHGYMHRTKNGIAVRTPPGRMVESEIDTERREIYLRSEAPKEVDPERFRRGLFKIALNLVAAVDGLEAALSPNYDRVRSYVRQPTSPTHRLPYVQSLLFKGYLDEIPEVKRATFFRGKENGFDCFRLILLSDEFHLDLFQPELIGEIVRANYSHQDKSRFVFHGTDGKERTWDGDDFLVPKMTPQWIKQQGAQSKST